MKLPQIPADIKEPLSAFLRDLLGVIRDEESRTLKRQTAASSVYLMSPSKKVYSLSVDDSGTIVTTVVKE